MPTEPDRPDATLPKFARARTPAFRLDSSREDEGGIFTEFFRSGTAPQAAFDERFPRILSDIDVLRGTLTPGFSDLREARLNQVENARTRAVGNLRDSLARRRVLGSSFGDDQLIRAELEFAQEAANQEALTFLEELDANSRILAFESQQMFAALERELAELGISADFSVRTADLFSRNLQFENELAVEAAAESSSATGSFVGTGLGFVSRGLGIAASRGAFDDLFTSGAQFTGGSGSDVVSFAPELTGGSGSDVFSLSALA